MSSNWQIQLWSNSPLDPSRESAPPLESSSTGTRSLTFPERTANLRFPFAIRRPIGAGQNHRVTVRVAKPHLPVVGATVTLGRVAMARQDDFRLKLPGADCGSVKILHFKPQQHAIAMSQVRVADPAMMMLHLPTVQLHEQLAVGHQLLVLASAMAAPAAQQFLVPTTAGFDISHANQRLWTHGRSVTKNLPLRNHQQQT